MGRGQGGGKSGREESGDHMGSLEENRLDWNCSDDSGPASLTSLQASVTELEGHVKYQRLLLWAAVFLLEPGGTLVYSTCTLNPLENEGMVRYALDTYPCLRLEDHQPR
jgi:methyltransferase NSUN6